MAAFNYFKKGFGDYLEKKSHAISKKYLP